MIKSDVGSKLRALFFNISFLDRMLDAVFIERITIKPTINDSFASSRPSSAGIPRRQDNEP